MWRARAMARLSYPSWIRFVSRDRVESLEEALGAVAAFSAQIEVFKIVVLSRGLASGRLGARIQEVSRIIGRGSEHLAALSLLGDPLRPLAVGSEDLDYSLSSLLDIENLPELLAISAIVVFPAHRAIAAFASSRSADERLARAMGAIAADGAEDLEALQEILVEERPSMPKMVEMLEERAVALFATAGAEDRFKISLASAVQGRVVGLEEAHKILRDLYAAIDSSREEAAKRLAGSEELVGLIKRYGLSKPGIC